MLPSRCVCCGAAQETFDHLFVQCPLADYVWKHYARSFGSLP